MSEAQISGLWTLLYVILTTGGILLIYFLIWTGLWHPIKKKDKHIKELEDTKKELYEIQREKGIEWDRYKEQQDELDRLRKAYFQLKDDTTKMKEERAKLKVDRDNLVTHIRELKKQVPGDQKAASEKTEK